MIKIDLDEKEDAIVYAEKTLGRNKQSKKERPYYKLSKICGINRDCIRRTLQGFEANGINYIYQCSRGIRHSALDKIEAELLTDFEKDPPASIPEAVSRIQKDYGLKLTDTPVRYWLRKKGFVISGQRQFRQKQI